MFWKCLYVYTERVFWKWFQCCRYPPRRTPLQLSVGEKSLICISHHSIITSLLIPCYARLACFLSVFSDRRIVLRMGRKIEDEESALSSSKPSRTKKGSSSRKKGGSATPIDPSPAPIKESAVASEEQVRVLTITGSTWVTPRLSHSPSPAPPPPPTRLPHLIPQCHRPREKRRACSPLRRTRCFPARPETES